MVACAGRLRSCLGGGDCVAPRWSEGQKRQSRSPPAGLRSGKGAGLGTLAACLAAVVRPGLPVTSAPDGITPARRCQGDGFWCWLRDSALTPPVRRDWLRPPKRREDRGPEFWSDQKRGSGSAQGEAVGLAAAGLSVLMASQATEARRSSARRRTMWHPGLSILLWRPGLPVASAGKANLAGQAVSSLA